ncbi:MAG: HAD hydrolase-like protein [Frankiales bacterium]|nr:HAD hydrolase-like protein [Frankiales bacterium]
MADAVLFDLDRTLVDLQSATDYAAALADARRVAGPLAADDAPATDWTHETRAAMALLVACSGDARWEAVSAAIAAHEAAALPRSVPMPGLHEAWALAAVVPRAVVTLLPEPVAREALARHGIAAGDAELVVVGRRPDDRPKPAPDGLLRACVTLGVAPSAAVMIGDSSWDAEAARAAGTGFVGVPQSAAAFPEGTETAADLCAAVRRVLGG